MKKKTLEELRARARERQGRWRAKNRRTHLERVKEAYGRSKAQGMFAGGVTPQEIERYGAKVEGGEVEETYYAQEEGVDIGYREGGGNENEGGRKAVANRAAGERSGEGRGVEAEVVTRNELETYERLLEIVGRQKGGGQGGEQKVVAGAEGLEVEME